MKQIIELGEIISGGGDFVFDSGNSAGERQAGGTPKGVGNGVKMRSNKTGSPAIIAEEDAKAFRVPIKNTYNDTVTYQTPKKKW